MIELSTCCTVDCFESGRRSDGENRPVDALEKRVAPLPQASKHRYRSRTVGLGGDITIKEGWGAGSAETARPDLYSLAIPWLAATEISLGKCGGAVRTRFRDDTGS